jgi:DNA-binding FrmR family transcriptional regulator
MVIEPETAPTKPAAPQGVGYDTKRQGEPMASEVTADVLNHLESIAGHVRGIQRMVEDGKCCIVIVNQILAVQRGMQKVNGMVLDCHLHTCAMTAVRGEDPDERERVVEEIWSVFNATGKL